MDTLNIDTKSQLAKLIATENITVQQNNVKTASFDVVNRILTLPIFKTDSKDVTDMLVAHECAHALFTPTNGWKKVSDDEELRSYVNVLEDCRIDKKIQKKYPGVVTNYVNGFEILNRQNFFGLKDKDYDTDLMLIDKVNIFYKSSKKLQFNFSNTDNLWLKQVDSLKSFNDVVTLAKKMLEWQKKEIKKLKKLPDFDNHILVENYDLNNNENDSQDSKDLDKEGDSEKSNEEGKDKQESPEGKTESESDQDKPAVGDKSAKDEDATGGGAVGSGGESQLTSITNNWFEGHKEKLLDQIHLVHKNIDKHILLLEKILCGDVSDNIGCCYLDEKYVTEKAYENPKFVEDIVRDIATELKSNKKVSNYIIESENFESIHNHSAYALIKGNNS